jgi:dTDP-4-dehydrorhamnose reductase
MDMDKNVMILGAEGMLAYDIIHTLQQGYHLHAFDRSQLNITDPQQVHQEVQNVHPQWIINCAAMTAVDRCETETELAMQINGYALQHIAQSAKEVGAKVIHFSTDYVFDGENQEGYAEDSRKHPINVYGQSKALGEDVLLQENPQHSYIIRTAWLYGLKGKNFVYTMLEAAKKPNSIRVVDDQRGSPTYTKDLALATKNIMDNMPAGIYHVTNSGECSWYEFTKEIFRQANIHAEISPITSKDYPRPAHRPACSVLKNSKITPLRPWQEALSDFLTQIL